MYSPAAQSQESQETDQRVRARAEHPHVLAGFRGKYSHRCRKGRVNDAAECSGFHPVLGGTGVPQNQNLSNVDESLKLGQSYEV